MPNLALYFFFNFFYRDLDQLTLGLLFRFEISVKCPNSDPYCGCNLGLNQNITQL